MIKPQRQTACNAKIMNMIFMIFTFYLDRFSTDQMTVVLRKSCGLIPKTRIAISQAECVQGESSHAKCMKAHRIA